MLLTCSSSWSIKLLGNTYYLRKDFWCYRTDRNLTGLKITHNIQYVDIVNKFKWSYNTSFSQTVNNVYNYFLISFLNEVLHWLVEGEEVTTFCRTRLPVLSSCGRKHSMLCSLSRTTPLLIIFCTFPPNKLWFKVLSKLQFTLNQKYG